MMSTFCSKHVEAWNKYTKKECVKLVINQNYVKMHGQKNIKFRIVLFKINTLGHTHIAQKRCYNNLKNCNT
jgi:hypothetical protein